MVRLNKFEDSRGSLYPLDFSKLPFIPKRIFYVCNVPMGEERGKHAHYKTQQLIVCIQGLIEVITFDGKNTNSIFLKPGDNYFLDTLTWDSQIFHTGKDILLSLCSTEYDIKDYILDKDEFIQIINNDR